MTYRLFLLPTFVEVDKTNVTPVELDEFPVEIVRIVEKNPYDTVIVTQTKTFKNVFEKCSKTKIFERRWFENTGFIFDFIEKQKPRTVILDNCFLETDSFFLDKVFDIKKKQEFDLINILHVLTAKNFPLLAKIELTQYIDFPTAEVELATQFPVEQFRKFCFYV